MTKKTVAHGKKAVKIGGLTSGKKARVQICPVRKANGKAYYGMLKRYAKGVKIK